MGLCFLAPVAPIAVAVVSDSIAAPKKTPWAQLSDWSTGTEVSESLPPYRNPLIGTPSGLSAFSSAFSSSFILIVYLAFLWAARMSLPALSFLPLCQSPEKFSPLSGSSFPMPSQYGTPSLMRILENMSSLGVVIVLYIRASSIGFTSSIMPKIPCSTLTALATPSSPGLI